MENKGKICILHIGGPKTGSTSLQKFLFKNRANLNREGWAYPDVNIRGYGHHDLAFLLGGGYPQWASKLTLSLEDISRSLVDCLKTKSRVIISSENFYLLPDPERLAGLIDMAGFSPGSIKVVVYIRRQDEAHVSWYNQAVKAQGYTGTILESVDENRLLWNYAARLDDWAKVFGHAHLIVRPYQDGDLAGGDTRHDFLQIVGLSPEKFEWTAEPVNTRINRDLLEFQRILNGLPVSTEKKRLFHKKFIELSRLTEGTELFSQAPLMTEKQRYEVFCSYEASNSRVASKYLGRDVLFKFKPDPCKDDHGYDGLKIEKIAAIIGWLLIQDKGEGEDGGKVQL
ncbi:hypothetical protein DSCW_11690 [Desulfosarcina widdelii]|uniref:Sulfotransferase domain-containing protein n=1 Tax=Desulfosarcina widdelii TaxID=947919 RepID=A0A5K7YVG4_9BACT|nr:hypothetical protein [Desulfosarcina widdelii]BBO73752.1 hypothetical protein DSCW_11690 [Desulfosarcina widdelii]